MKVIRLPLADIKRPERNVRIHTEKQLREFSRSITMFGQIRPIVIDEYNTIMAGVGCYETLLKLGRTEGDFYKIEGLSENQKKKLMIADNKIFGLGIEDLDTFNTFLDELQQDLDIPGYDEEILRSMVAAADDLSDTIREYGNLDAEDLAGIASGREKKESMMETAQTSTLKSESPATPQVGENTEVQKSIICPGCGETIWL